MVMGFSRLVVGARRTGRSIVRSEATFASDGGGVARSMQDPNHRQLVSCCEIIGDIRMMKHGPQPGRQLRPRSAGGRKIAEMFKAPIKAVTKLVAIASDFSSSI